MRNPLPVLVASSLWALPALASAQDEQAQSRPASRTGRPPAPYALRAGRIDLRSGLATVDLPESCRWLDAKDARYVLEKAWHNPPDEGVLCLIVDQGFDPFGPEGWAIVVTYEDGGHVDDSDAKGLDYTALLATMQQQARDESVERKKHGYPEVELLGWAEPPHYDAAAKKIYWAKRLRFGADGEESLNYCVRFLGRKGVLEMNAIGDMAQLAQVAARAKEVLPRTEFGAGNRYEDFDAGVDKVAAYGIGSLIAGGVLVKTGFFKLAWLFVLKFIKPILIGLVALGVLVMKALGARKAARVPVTRRGGAAGPDAPAS